MNTWQTETLNTPHMQRVQSIGELIPHSRFPLCRSVLITLIPITAFYVRNLMFLAPLLEESEVSNTE